MNLTQAFKMAFKSIWSKKMRSLLTMLGIIIGIAAVMIIVSVITVANKKQMEYYESMGTNKIQVTATLDNGGDAFSEVYTYCKSIDMVLGVTPSGTVSGTVKYGAKNSASMEWPPSVYLGSDQYALCNNFQIERGRDISAVDIEKYNAVCVLGARAAKDFFDAADPVGKSISIDGTAFTVVGVYREKDPNPQYSLDNLIVIPYTAQRYLPASAGDMSEFVVKAKDAPSVSKVIALLNGNFGSWSQLGKGDFWCYSDQQWQNDSNQQALMMSLMLGAIAGISLLVGGIGIMNIMLVSVTERTREIGIRRAIGAERRSIVVQFLIESGMICGIGGIIGIAVGFVGTAVASRIIVQTVMLPSPAITLFAFLFSVALGVLFGMFPAIKASKLQPVAALRAE